MNPITSQELYKKTAKRLSLPEEFIRDLVEEFYRENREGMHNLTHVVFNIHGLGRFLIRPLKFWSREAAMKKLIERFAERRDNRGLMIRKELETRYEQMQVLKPEVQKLFDFYDKTKKNMEESE